MAWIELHDTIWEHHKTVKLCDELAISEVQAVGHLVSLWQFAMRNAPETGDLSSWDDCGIAKAARWQTHDAPISNAEGFCNALRNAKLLDGHKIHDWDEFTLHFKSVRQRVERKRELVRERVRNYRQKQCNANVTLEKKNVTQCNADTKPNLTIPNHTKPKQTIPPDFESVKSYCLARTNGIDPQAFIDFYEARGWMIGKNKMKSWEAAVRTWERNSKNAPQKPTQPNDPYAGWQRTK